eukprot:s21_g20.t1
MQEMNEKIALLLKSDIVRRLDTFGPATAAYISNLLRWKCLLQKQMAKDRLIQVSLQIHLAFGLFLILLMLALAVDFMFAWKTWNTMQRDLTNAEQQLADHYDFAAAYD